jgi:TetR/AcrR family transcriptional regulator
MGVTERRLREKESRIQSIKKSAARLFARKGFSNVSMAEIAEAAEVSKGTLYIYFKSKEELYFSLIEPVLVNHHKLIARIVSDDSEPADQSLRKFFDYFADSYPLDPQAHQPYMYYRAEEVQPLFSEERHGYLKTLMAKNVETIEAVILRGIEQGIFKSVNPRAVSSILWSLVTGVLRWEENRRFAHNKDFLKPTLRAAMNLMLDGLKV